MASDAAKADGVFGQVNITLHGSDSTLVGQAGRGTGIVFDERGGQYVNKAIAAVLVMCDA